MRAARQGDFGERWRSSFWVPGKTQISLAFLGQYRSRLPGSEVLRLGVFRIY